MLLSSVLSSREKIKKPFLNKSIKISINFFFGPLLFLILSWSLYHQVIDKPNLGIQLNQIKNSWINWKLWLVVFLMLANWSIEAIKWKLLVNHVQAFSFFRAFKSVLSGCSITILTPNRIGEYGGRILYIENGNRIKAISLAMVGSISQLLVTMIIGCSGLFFLRYFSQYDNTILRVIPEFWEAVITSLCVGLTVILLLFYLRLGWLVRMMEKVPALHKAVKHISVLDEFNNIQLVQILSLSFVRYLVFVFQYLLLLQVMEVKIAVWLCFWLVAIFYLVMAVAPTLGFIELPVRVSASWIIFQFYTTNELGVATAALGIWLINLVVPAIIGSLLIFSVKIVKDK